MDVVSGHTFDHVRNFELTFPTWKNNPQYPDQWTYS